MLGLDKREDLWNASFIWQQTALLSSNKLSWGAGAKKAIKVFLPRKGKKRGEKQKNTSHLSPMSTFSSQYLTLWMNLNSLSSKKMIILSEMIILSVLAHHRSEMSVPTVAKLCLLLHLWHLWKFWSSTWLNSWSILLNHCQFYHFIRNMIATVIKLFLLLYRK